MLVLPSWDLLLRWFHSLLVDKPLQLPLPNVSFDLLLQVVAVGGVMTDNTIILLIKRQLGMDYRKKV